MSKPDKSKKESLERLKQQLFVAESKGDTALAKKIKSIIERLISKNK